MAATPGGGGLWELARGAEEGREGHCGYLSQEKYLETSSYISYAH